MCKCIAALDCSLAFSQGLILFTQIRKHGDEANCSLAMRQLFSKCWSMFSRVHACMHLKPLPLQHVPIKALMLALSINWNHSYSCGMGMGLSTFCERARITYFVKSWALLTESGCSSFQNLNNWSVILRSLPCWYGQPLVYVVRTVKFATVI